MTELKAHIEFFADEIGKDLQLALDRNGEPLAVLTPKEGAQPDDLQGYADKHLVGFHTLVSVTERLHADLERRATDIAESAKRFGSVRDAIIGFLNDTALARYRHLPKHAVPPMKDAAAKREKVKAQRVAAYKARKAARAQANQRVDVEEAELEAPRRAKAARSDKRFQQRHARRDPNRDVQRGPAQARWGGKPV